MNEQVIIVHRCSVCSSLVTMLCRPIERFSCPVCGKRAFCRPKPAAVNHGRNSTPIEVMMKQTISYESYREYLLAFLREADDDLAEKRKRFTTFLHMDQQDLDHNSDFVSFLVATTDELIDRAARLNSMARTMALAGTDAA